MTKAITAEGTLVFLGPPAGTPFPTYVLLGETGSVEPLGHIWDVNDVTNQQSSNTKEKIKGLRNPGQYNLIGNRIFGDASQAALKAAFDDPQQAYLFQVWLPVNPNTGVGEVWTFAALVLSIDPPIIAPNKALRFFSKLQVTGKRQTSNGYLNATGAITWNESRPLAFHFESVLWSDFAIAPTAAMPADAVIQGIYPVFIGSATFASVTTMAFLYGPGAILDTVPAAGVLPFTSPSNPNESTFASTEFYGPSIGTSLSALTGQKIMSVTDCSLFLGPPLTDAVNITGVGFAIVYASSTPRIDPQMPPPFALPAGQGLAWAVPFAAANTGSTGEQGTATATAVMLNSI